MIYIFMIEFFFGLLFEGRLLFWDIFRCNY